MAKGDVTARFHKGQFQVLPDGTVKLFGECRKEMEGPDGDKIDVGGCEAKITIDRTEVDALINKLIPEVKKDDHFKDMTIS